MGAGTAARLVRPDSGREAAGSFEVRSVRASLFSTLVAALIESLMPEADVWFMESLESDGLRSTDVLLSYSLTGRRLVVFGSTPDRESVSRHLNAGTHSMISVDASREELIAAFDSISDGPAFVSTAIVLALASSQERGPGSVLTNREREIVAFVVEGLSNREMAATLCLSPNTIRTHLQSASAKLGVSSRAKLAARARALGIA